jgi:hypothetical protein
MGISTFPNVASPIKSIQRGSVVTSGAVTISSVKPAKTQVSSFSTGSQGQVGVSGNIPAMTGTVGATTTYISGFTANFGFTGGNYTITLQNYNASNANYSAPNSTYNVRYSITTYAAPAIATYNSPTPNYATTAAGGASSTLNVAATNLNFNTQALGVGDTNLFSGAFGAYLVDATTIYATGSCRYEVVEHY